MNELTSENIVYAFAHCESWIEYYARSHKLPTDELAGKVAGLLLSQTGKSLLVPPEVVRADTIRREPANENAEPVKIVEPQHRETQVSTSLDPIDREIRRSFKWVKCKYCPKKMRSTDMGNHIKYAHHGKSTKTGKASRKTKKRKKRKLSPKVIAAMRKNLALAREAKAKKKKKKTTRYFSPQGIQKLREAKRNYWKERKERERQEALQQTQPIQINQESIAS